MNMVNAINQTTEYLPSASNKRMASYLRQGRECFAN